MSENFCPRQVNSQKMIHVPHNSVKRFLTIIGCGKKPSAHRHESGWAKSFGLSGEEQEDVGEQSSDASEVAFNVVIKPQDSHGSL